VPGPPVSGMRAPLCLDDQRRLGRVSLFGAFVLAIACTFRAFGRRLLSGSARHPASSPSTRPVRPAPAAARTPSPSGVLVFVCPLCVSIPFYRSSALSAAPIDRLLSPAPRSPFCAFLCHLGGRFSRIGSDQEEKRNLPFELTGPQGMEGHVDRWSSPALGEFYGA